MAQNDPESRPVIVLRESALKEAATMTRSHLAKLCVPQPDHPMARAGEMVVLTDEERSCDVVAHIEATDQGVMLVNPLEIVSTARSYRTEHSTPTSR